ncbi:MAG: 23S rRNA (uracil(1939)-C(5))-methyltransferase RlmD [Gammaproteobacteria bacterium]|jgi:23S rRNA (uracil1939-C5)-methyltransferase|nr:23S rRNA (uracil(1939)-C(5))-methyltransferase RlmD [Gammaproteobacteria bacterium]
MSQRRSPRNRLPTEPVRLEITALNHEGRGIGQVNGKPGLVDGALPDEVVTASVVRRRSQFDELRVTDIERASSNRIIPLCQFADHCGGCSLQHLEPAAQLQFKQSVLIEQLEKTAGIDATGFTLLPPIKGDSFHYRRKARLAVRRVMQKGGALVGFREKYSTFITDMNYCQVLVPEVASLIGPLREMISVLQANRDIPQIEVAVGEIRTAAGISNVVALVIRHLKPFSGDDLQLLTDFGKQHAIHLYLQPSGAGSVQKLFPESTSDRLQYFLPEFDLTLNFHPMDFTQVNAEINHQMVSQAIELLGLSKDDTVLDLFCGLGNFTLAIAGQCKQVIGIESSDAMVHRGAENAEYNKIANTQFYKADLCDSKVDNAWFSIPFTKVLLDPPRSGAIEILQQIVDLRVSKIVYVSCNPATLARDAKYLVGKGYRLKSAGVMDMFPHTAHVESMVEFELVD